MADGRGFTVGPHRQQQAQWSDHLRAVEMHAMNDPAALAGMLPFDSIGLYEQPKPRFIFKMPRVVPDQKSKFESDELFRRLSRESEVSHVC